MTAEKISIHCKFREQINVVMNTGKRKGSFAQAIRIESDTLYVTGMETESSYPLEEVAAVSWGDGAVQFTMQ